MLVLVSWQVSTAEQRAAPPTREEMNRAVFMVAAGFRLVRKPTKPARKNRRLFTTFELRNNYRSSVCRTSYAPAQLPRRCAPPPLLWVDLTTATSVPRRAWPPISWNKHLNRAKPLSAAAGGAASNQINSIQFNSIRGDCSDEQPLDGKATARFRCNGLVGVSNPRHWSPSCSTRGGICLH
jgi:hypothetical protein